MISNCRIIKRERKKTPDSVRKKHGEGEYFESIQLSCNGENSNFNATLDIGTRHNEKFADLEISGNVIEFKGKLAEKLSEGY